MVDNRTPTVKVKDLYKTSWVYRHEAYENFSLLYTYLVEVMGAICENDTSHGEIDRDHKTVVAVNGLSKMYHSFSFRISFVITRNAMSIIKKISVKLQYTSYDIVKAYNRVEEVAKELHAMRNDGSMYTLGMLRQNSWLARLMYFVRFLEQCLVNNIVTMFNIAQLRNTIEELFFLY